MAFAIMLRASNGDSVPLFRDQLRSLDVLAGEHTSTWWLLAAFSHSDVPRSRPHPAPEEISRVYDQPQRGRDQLTRDTR